MRARVFRYLLVGGVATAGHYGVLIALVSLFGFDAVFGSIVGSVVGTILNYTLNYTFTFNSNASHMTAFPKFLLVVFLGLCFNALLMAVFVWQLQVQYLIAQVLATLIVLAWNYWGSQRWVYQ